MSRSRRALPSVETQLVAFVDAARQGGEYVARPLRFGAFCLYTRYTPNYVLEDGTVFGETLTLAALDLGKAYQGRGWFWRLCQLSACLVADAVVVESVVNPRLLQSLRARPQFQEFRYSTFVLKKRAAFDWPLQLPVEPPPTPKRRKAS